MTPEIFFATCIAASIIAGCSGYSIGRYIGRADVVQAEKKGLHTAGMGAKIIAHGLASELLNRPQWPLDRHANVQRWKELGRREAYSIAASMVCKRFNVETPKRTI